MKTFKQFVAEAHIPEIKKSMKVLVVNGAGEKVKSNVGIKVSFMGGDEPIIDIDTVSWFEYKGTDYFPTGDKAKLINVNNKNVHKFESDDHVVMYMSTDMKLISTD